MLTRAELRVLTDWCRTRNMTWTAGRADGEVPALLLERPGRGADAMLLVVGATERRLLDAAGQELAVASDLPALLDAVDGGVGDAMPVAWPVRRAIAAPARHAA